MDGSEKKKDRGLLMLAIMLVAAILGGPAIFYGFLAMGEAGVFDNARGNFWPIVLGVLALVVAWWVFILFLGSRDLWAKDGE